MIVHSLRLSFVALVVLTGAAAAPAPASTDFPQPAALRTQVKFWQKIFGVYSKHQIVFHDPENLARVYSVLDFRDRAEHNKKRDTTARSLVVVSPVVCRHIRPTESFMLRTDG